MKLPEPPLLLITDRHQTRRTLVEVVAASLTSGCRWVSVREKDLPDTEQIALARMLAPMVWRHGGKLSLHGTPELAQAVKADGVHLPAGSDPQAARKLLGADKLIGVSIHSVGEAEAIDPASVDYAVAGPAFETAVLSSTAEQPSSMASAASEAVPMPASSTTGTGERAHTSSMRCGLQMPSPEPIGAPSGITAAAPTSASLRQTTGSSVQ